MPGMTMTNIEEDRHGDYLQLNRDLSRLFVQGTLRVLTPEGGLGGYHAFNDNTTMVGETKTA